VPSQYCDCAGVDAPIATDHAGIVVIGAVVELATQIANDYEEKPCLLQMPGS
jgi:hypothetical protein